MVGGRFAQVATGCLPAVEVQCYNIYMLRKYLYLFILLVVITLFAAFAVVHEKASGLSGFDVQNAEIGVALLNEYSKARVLSVGQEESSVNKHFSLYTQTLRIRFLDGSNTQREADVDFQTTSAIQKLKAGDTVIVGQLSDARNNNGNPYVIVDLYRLPYVAVLVLVFLLCAVYFARWRGVTSVVGLAFSVFVLIYFIAPSILAGQNPVVISLVGAFIIAVVSLFLAHGFNERTSLAVISTLLTLGLAQGLAYLAIHGVRLFGNGSEEAYLLQAGSLGAFNLQGLLFGGIIIGCLGVLDDVTTGQTAAVDELHHTDSTLTLIQLYRKGMSIGREHIASLINTLVLAYAGAFFPLFLLIVLTSHQPLWVTLNSEFIAEEIVRTLVGSTALIVAVPLSTILAAWYFRRSTVQK